MRAAAMGQSDIAASDGAGDEKSARFEAVGNDGVRGAAKFVNAANAQGRRFVAADIRAHLAQQVNKVGDFGFAGGVFENGLAIGESGGHENIFRSGYRDFIEQDAGATKFSVVGNFGEDVAVLGGNFGTHFFQRGKMQVDRARADGASARQRNVRCAGAGKSGAESKDGGAHGFDEFVGRDGVVEAGSFYGVFVGGNGGGGNLGRHEGEKSSHGDNV